jgi:tRNA 2-thiouridine synthesizing protein E
MISVVALHENSHQPPLPLDSEGFLAEPSTWTREIAEQLTLLASVGELNDKHWAAIEYLRERHLRSGAIPTLRQICKASDLHRAQLKQLFGSCLNMWRIAGLPNPGDEARAYMN